MNAVRTQRLMEIDAASERIGAQLEALRPSLKSKDAQVFKQAVEDKKALRQELNALNREYWQIVFNGVLGGRP